MNNKNIDNSNNNIIVVVDISYFGVALLIRYIVLFSTRNTSTA